LKFTDSYARAQEFAIIQRASRTPVNLSDARSAAITDLPFATAHIRTTWMMLALLQLPRSTTILLDAAA
jgi:hypothetical protein